MKDHGDGSGPLIATKKDFIRMYHGAPVSGFVNVLVYFNKLVNNF